MCNHMFDWGHVCQLGGLGGGGGGRVVKIKEKMISGGVTSCYG